MRHRSLHPPVSIAVTLVGAALLAGGGGAVSRALAVDPTVDAAYASRLHPFLADYCFGCHGREKARGDLNLERFGQDPAYAANRDLWEKVRDAIESREMPPEGKKQPGEVARVEVVQYLDGEFERVDDAMPASPGRVTLRRLNRNEYRNTIRDLLGIDFDAHSQFPNDESGYGFDNIGDVLSLPPMLLEKYLAAAEAIATRAIVTEDPALKRVRRIPARAFTTQADAVSTVEEEVWGFYREGEITTQQDFAAAGDYLLRLRAYGEQAGPELPRMGVRFDGREIHVQPVRATAEKGETFEVKVRVDAPGTHRLGVAYLNNFNSDGDRNVYLQAFEVVGPLGGAPEEYPESHRRVLPQRVVPGREQQTAEEALRAFASKAFRRPATQAEVQRLAGFVEMARKDGASFEEGVRLAVQAVLVSPHFLYRWELDPEGRNRGAESGPDNLKLGDGGLPIRELSDYELASRLSYFLWSSMPDDALFARAERGELRQPEVLESEVRRMLRDPRCRELVRNFGGQWLQIRNLEAAEPDVTLFPGWGPELREAMRRETELFLRAVMDEDRSIRDLVDADFTFVNERLARHYGLDGVQGEDFRRVPLPAGSGRGGVITMGSVLTITSVPTRTAPVLRGKWIMEQILGTPPPPPPPNVPPVETGEAASKSATLRQRLELHRSKPDCLACHQKMDPLGFALENFDGIGAWRDKDGPHPIDNAAELPGGRKFEGARGLKEILVKGEEFPRALASKMLTYALGRGLEFQDRRAVRQIVDSLAAEDYRFSALVMGIVRSEPFRKRQLGPSNHEQHASIHSHP